MVARNRMTKPIQIVVAYNFAHSSESALRYAIDLARRSVRRVFHFVCIIDPHAGVPAVPANGKIDYVYADKVQHALAAKIEKAFEASDVPEAVHYFVHARLGEPADEILFLAKGVGADLVIVGSIGLTGVERALIGSVSEAVVRGAGCPVVVARPKSYADVELIPITEVEPSHHYTPPHRYSYEETRVTKRPIDWPLY